MSKKIVLAFLLAVALLTSGSAALDVIKNHKSTAADLPFPPPCFPGEVCSVNR
jgi:hypothetical protein